MAQRSQLGEYLKQQFLNGQGIVTQGPGPYPKAVVAKIGAPYMNKGYDIGVPVGTPINTKGLKFVGSKQDRTGYGTRAAYQDQAGKTYIFSHLSKLQETPEGVMAYTGGIPGVHGRSTGPHLDIDLSGNLAGFSGMLRNIAQNAAGVGQRAYQQVRKSTPRVNPQDVLAKAKSIYGNKVRGVASSADRLKEAQSKYGGRIVKL